MPSVKKRLAASVLLMILSIATIIILLPRDSVTKFQKIALGSTMDHYGSLWTWGTESEVDTEIDDVDGIRLVVFGDSWVDDPLETTHKEKGKSWTQVFCEEIHCTSRLNFATSQPADAWPALPPVGVMISNPIHDFSDPQLAQGGMAKELTFLPDLATQIQSFISLPVSNHRPREVIFIISFGFWDIYDFAHLDLTLGKNVTDATVQEVFNQLDILYQHFTQNLTSPIGTADSDIVPAATPRFRLIVPKVFDPTLLSGWISQRPVPPAPSNVAEQQKNAVYLTNHFNFQVDTKLREWINTPEPPFINATDSPASTGTEPTGTALPSSTEPAPSPEAATPPLFVEKDVFYYDLPKYLVEMVMEQQLEAEGISDANGLGKKESPFESVYQPCVRGVDDGGDLEGAENIKGMLICNNPEEYMWWDAFSLGSHAKVGIGKEVAGMFKEGKHLKTKWQSIREHAEAHENRLI